MNRKQDVDDRVTLITHFLEGLEHNVSELDIRWLCERLEGWSRSDLSALAKRVSMGSLLHFTCSLACYLWPSGRIWLYLDTLRWHFDGLMVSSSTPRTVLLWKQF